MNMDTKNYLVFLMAVMSMFLVVSTVSAAELADIEVVDIDEVSVNYASVTAGEFIEVEVLFVALEDASDVRIKVEIEGNKEDVSVQAGPFVIEEGQAYKKTLGLRVPYELKDEVSDGLTLSVKIWDDDDRTLEEYDLNVQRPAYNVGIMSMSTYDVVNAGETIPVDVVLKNIGYNDLDDLEVSVSIPELGVSRETYFGDIVALECFDEDGCDEDDEDTVRGRLYLRVPYEAEAGVYELEVEVSNSDLTVTDSEAIQIRNDFSGGNIITSSVSKTFAVGDKADYVLVIANPSSNLKVYHVVAESSGDISTSVDSSVVVIPAGSSKEVTVTAVANSDGDYTFNVNLISGGEIAGQVTLTANVEGSSASITSPIMVLTIVLAIVFLVLLVVLIVLLGKKPEKTEDFGESYY